MQEEKKDTKRFETLQEFEPFWWGEHTDRNCKRLHVIGSTFALICWAYFMYSRD